MRRSSLSNSPEKHSQKASVGTLLKHAASLHNVSVSRSEPGFEREAKCQGQRKSKHGHRRHLSQPAGGSDDDVSTTSDGFETAEEGEEDEEEDQNVLALPNMDEEEWSGRGMVLQMVRRGRVDVPTRGLGDRMRHFCPSTSIPMLSEGGQAQDGVEAGGDSETEDGDTQQQGKHHNVWEQPGGEVFSVRGADYLQDGVKVHSQEPAYTLLGLDLLVSEERHHCLGNRPNGFVQRWKRRAGDRMPFVLCLNFCLPWGTFAGYFSPKHGRPGDPYTDDPTMDGLLREFLDDGPGAQQRRDDRLKIIPICHEGPWLVRKSITGKPAIIGHKIDTTYHRGEGWIEVETDITTSKTALYILGMVKNFTEQVSVDLGWVFEGFSRQELPERLLCSLRFHHLDVLGAVDFDAWEAREEEEAGEEDEEDEEEEEASWSRQEEERDC